MTDLAQVTRTSVGGRLRRWDAARGVLVLLCLLVLVAGYTLGARESPYAELRSQVAAGQVDTVTVHGEGLGPGGQGFTTLRVTWRDGLLPRVADVVESARVPEPGSDLVVSRSDVADLRALDPDLVVVEDPTDLLDDTALLGFSVPGWMFWMPFALLLGGMSLLARRPEPWRATRWGWFWPMLLVPVLGPLAYAALSGPGFLPEPHSGARRLTGGWSFLLVGVGLGALFT